MSVVWVHLLAKLLKQARVKGVRFDTVNNFNDNIQYAVKFWSHFLACQHFPVNDAVAVGKSYTSRFTAASIWEILFLAVLLTRNLRRTSTHQLAEH